MSKKDKTVSFRVSEDSFESLRDIAERRGLSLSSLFRNYVDMLVAHEGQVKIVPEHVDTAASNGDSESFPPRVTVPKSFVREHERLELEAEHLREQLDEYKEYATELESRLDDAEDEDIVHLDELEEAHLGDLDEEADEFRIG
jgi:hypothetical protein